MARLKLNNQKATSNGLGAITGASMVKARPTSGATATTTTTPTGSDITKAIIGAGGLGGVMALPKDTTTKTGTGRSGSGSGSGAYVGVVSTPKPVNPYDRTGTGEGGGNPYAELQGQYKPTSLPEGLGDREGLYGVSEGTREQMGRYGEYRPSEQVEQAYQYLQGLRQRAPGEYQDPYADQLQQLYQDIVSRPKFSYDLNGDMLYKQYAQQYQQMGQQAMQDAMGQAAALTGGYGSSYASTAGNQAYQGYLNQLNNIIPELYDRALNTYLAEGDQKQQQYSMLRDMAQTDYGRYQDALSRYYQDLGLASQDYQTERSFDYGQYGDARDYWTQMAQLESQDAWRGRDDELTRAQMQIGLDQDYRDYQLQLQQLMTGYDQTAQDRDRDLLMTMIQMGIDPSDALKQGSGISDYDLWELMQKYKPTSTGMYYTGAGSGTGSGRSGTTRTGAGDGASIVGADLRSRLGQQLAGMGLSALRGGSGDQTGGGYTPEQALTTGRTDPQAYYDMLRRIGYRLSAQ